MAGIAAGGGVAPAEPAAGNAEGASRTQIAEVADNARTRWTTGLKVNLDLGKMGIAPWNRGKLGVSSFHVADVVHSITQDGLSRNRYHEVQVIRVPESALEEFKQFNRDILAACPQLPPFSERMEYACLTKHLGFTFPLCDWLSLFICDSVGVWGSECVGVWVGSFLVSAIFLSLSVLDSCAVPVLAGTISSVP